MEAPHSLFDCRRVVEDFGIQERCPFGIGHSSGVKAIIGAAVKRFWGAIAGERIGGLRLTSGIIAHCNVGLVRRWQGCRFPGVRP